jgi:riboflavin kinase/FMN adenylyltransferase
MKVYNHIDEFMRRANTVATIGTFDGVHVGHRKILSRLKEAAEQKQAETVILTFFPHPRMILHPEDQNLKLITTIKEKAELLEQLGIDHLIITPFTRDFSNQAPEEYIKTMLVDKIGISKIITGYDHRYGKDRTGGLPELLHYSKQYGFDVEEIPEQDIHDVAVSSTKIRQALLQGNIDMANDFLGYPFMLTGKVIRGDQIGRSLGYPTANLFVEETYKLIPADGIYAVEVEHEGRHVPLQGMAYIGHRPTINGMTRNIEVNIFDFSQDLYGQTLRMHFRTFIRPDLKLSGLDELKSQLGDDEKAIRAYFENA